MKIRQTLQCLFSTICPTSELNCAFKLTIVEEEYVCRELKKLKTSKTTGLKNIPTRLLKDGANMLAKPLTLLINRSPGGNCPSDWKHATVTPIYKSGPKTDPANYRPISVLPVFVKILDRAVHNMVYSYLQENKLCYLHINQDFALYTLPVPASLMSRINYFTTSTRDYLQIWSL